MSREGQVFRLWKEVVVVVGPAQASFLIDTGWRIVALALAEEIDVTEKYLELAEGSGMRLL